MIIKLKGNTKLKKEMKNIGSQKSPVKFRI